MPASSPPVRAVLLDMDDTVFDHTRTCEVALASLWRETPVLQRLPFPQVLREYARLLEAVHPGVMVGILTHEKAREERFRQLFALVGEEISPSEARQYSTEYRARYQRARQAVPGATELLRSLEGRAVIGIVSNNHQEEQSDKLRAIGLSDAVDFLLTSEKAGALKPDPLIFAQALREAGCDRSEAVMVGDSWPSDVRGALGAGIRAVWFNRFAAPAPEPVEVPQLRSWTPLDEVERVLFPPPRPGG